MEGGFISDKEKLTFREIVLAQIKKILEISSKELRDQTYQVISSSYTDIRYQEDTRESYIQAIENLAYILMPHFDKKIESVYQECICIINSYSFQIAVKFKDEIEEIKKHKKTGEISSDYYVNKRIQYAKILFCELNLLLKRIDYLKSAVYTESDLDLDNEEDVRDMEGGESHEEFDNA